MLQLARQGHKIPSYQLRLEHFHRLLCSVAPQKFVEEQDDKI